MELVNSKSVQAGLRTLDLHDHGWELVLELRMSTESSKEESELLAELKTLEGVRKASLLAPQLALPV